MPNNDFYVTTGHHIVIDGVSTKVRNIPEAKQVVPPKNEVVYSICVDQNQPILVNNLPVIAWGYDKWIKYVEKNNISWKNNVLID